MNPKVKAKWLKALRSGEYDQTESTLLERTPEGDKFCCLGVLCNLYAQEHPGTGFRLQDHNYKFFGTSWNLPAKVVQWAKISLAAKYPNNRFTLDSAETKLIGLNDNGKDFNKIADWIERNL